MGYRQNTLLFIIQTSLYFLSPGLATAGDAYEWNKVKRIVAAADIHGDYQQLVKTLRAAGVIDANLSWIAGKAHLVQTGDVLDRGPDSKKAMDLLMKLEKEAKQAGGCVHALLGNHEVMNLAGDLRYVHPGEIESHGGAVGFKRALSSGGLYGSWILGHNVIVRINDVLFLHGGIGPTYASHTLQSINETVRRAIKENPHSRTGIAWDPEGPLWYRGYALQNEETVCTQIDMVLKTFGAAHIVVGHTVSKEGIQVRCQGRIIMIDVGMSAYYGGPASCLVIEESGFFAIEPTDRRKLPVGPRLFKKSNQRKSTIYKVCQRDSIQYLLRFFFYLSLEADILVA